MKFCDQHWSMLKAEIASVGLNRFGAKDGKAAFAQTVASLENAQAGVENGAAQFDPLMGAHWAIVNNAMPYVGLELMTMNEDGTHKCPLCFITADHKARCEVVGCTVENFDEWIVKAVEGQLQGAKGLGLMGDA